MLVYKITNKINPRVYVGLTVCTLEKRWREHRSAANTGVEKPLYRAMRKHGIENFSIELLYAAKDFDDLRAAELRFIEELKAHTLDGGYNLTDHGARYGAPNSPKGEIQYKSKLTEEMVAFIRDPVHWDKDNTDLLNMVNQKFNNDLSRDTVRDARRGDSWKHLNEKYHRQTWSRTSYQACFRKIKGATKRCACKIQTASNCKSKATLGQTRLKGNNHVIELYNSAWSCRTYNRH